MPGPPPKPIELKRRLGNPGKRALPAPKTVLPVAVGGTPKPPSGLKRQGKAAWERLWSVGAAWLSPTTDLEIVTRLCQAYDERAYLRGVVALQGYFTAGSMGQTVVHPAVKEVRALEAAILAMEARCGFTPSDRSRLGMAEVQRVSKLDEILQRRQARAAAE
jgi:P27 family predicted phage terminase small subunit